MSDFGIPGYAARWLTGLSAIRNAHGDRLGRLAGRTLTRAWLVWDLDDDEWFADAPLLLDFDGEQVELNHWKFDELSVTWNTVDPTRPLSWPGSDSDFTLAWREDVPPELAALRGQALLAVELLEWQDDKLDLANGSVAVSFVLANDRVTVYNALDENGLTVGEPDERWRRHPLT